MLVTTSLDASESTRQRSIEAAERTGGVWVPRRGFSLAKLRTAYGDPNILLVTERELQYIREDAKEPLFFHPSTAQLRIKRLLRGERDTLIDISHAAPGDHIVDCTAGLGSDAIVFSHIAGPGGHVLAIESTPVLTYLLKVGLAEYVSDVPEVNEAMRRIELSECDHLDRLRLLPDRSVDIVYFDPMFRIPVYDSSSLTPLRAIANAEALRVESVEQARRVARKTIVLKEHKDSGEFQRLGFTPISRNPSKFTYGVIHT